MEILIAIVVSLVVMLGTIMWVIDKLKTYKEDLGKSFDGTIDSMVSTAFTNKRRELWWADYDSIKATLKTHANEWFKEYAEFRDKTTDRFIACNNDMKELTAKIDRLQQTDGIAADDVGEIRQMCLELQKANTVLMRTILERFPLPEKPTTPVRRKR